MLPCNGILAQTTTAWGMRLTGRPWWVRLRISTTAIVAGHATGGQSIAEFVESIQSGQLPAVSEWKTSNPPEFGWHVSYMDYATRPWVVWTMMGNGTGPECFNAESCY